MKIKQMQPQIKEIILYIIFGLITTLLNWAIFAICKVFCHVLVANIIAWIISLIFAYIVNKKYVFQSITKNKKEMLKEIVSFSSSRLFTLGCEETGLFIFLSLLHFNTLINQCTPSIIDGEIIIKIALTVFCTILNYLFGKITFQNKEREV